MNGRRMKTSPGRGEEKQRQQVSSEADELKSRGGNVRADRAGPVLRLSRARRVPRRIVRIERCRDEAKRQQQSQRDEKNRENLIATTRTRDDHARLFFNVCSCCHENSNCKPKDLRSFASEQVGLDEVVDVAAEHCLDVTSFQFSASVFYQLIGRQHVTPDLRPE